MNKMITTFLAAASLTVAASAFAADPPGDCATMEGDAKTQCEAAKAAADQATADAKKALEALGDCATMEGDDKTTCEAKKAELEAAAGAAPAAEKGGKAQRGNTNRLETKFEDE